MNKIDGVVERLLLINMKDRVTLKDVVLLKSELLLGSDATLQLELNWDYVFEDTTDVTGTKWYQMPLESCYATKKIGRPLTILGLVLKLALGIPEDVIKQMERPRKKAEYLAQVRVKDKRNPHYRRAMAKASTYVSTTVRRASDTFAECLESDPAYKRLWKLIQPILHERLSSPTPEDEESKRRHFLRMLQAIESQTQDLPLSK